MTSQPSHCWAFTLGRWAGVPIGVHLSLVVLLTCLLTLVTFSNPLLGGVLIGVWLASVLLHQLSHLFYAWRIGGEIEAVVVGPAGDMVPARVADEVEPQVVLALSGPFVHFFLSIISASALLLMGEADSLWQLSVARPQALLQASDPWTLMLVKSCLWVNWTLLFVNLLPVYPFDCAAFVRALLWPLAGRRTSLVMVRRLGMGAAAVLVTLGIYWLVMLPDAALSATALVALGLFVWVSARRELPMFDQVDFEAFTDDTMPFGDELEDDAWMHDDPNHMVLVEQHYDQLRERYERQRKAREDYEDTRVDDILARLHHDGYEHLSQEDRAFLRRASQRYRDRLRDRDASSQ